VTSTHTLKFWVQAALTVMVLILEVRPPEIQGRTPKKAQKTCYWESPRCCYWNFRGSKFPQVLKVWKLRTASLSEAWKSSIQAPQKSCGFPFSTQLESQTNKTRREKVTSTHPPGFWDVTALTVVVLFSEVRPP